MLLPIDNNFHHSYTFPDRIILYTDIRHDKQLNRLHHVQARASLFVIDCNDDQYSLYLVRVVKPNPTLFDRLRIIITSLLLLRNHMPCSTFPIETLV